jgi:hypothetical protein
MHFFDLIYETKTYISVVITCTNYLKCPFTTATFHVLQPSYTRQQFTMNYMEKENKIFAQGGSVTSFSEMQSPRMFRLKFLREDTLTYRISGRAHLENLDTDRRIIIKWMLNKQGVNAWIEFNWLRTGPNENSCECCKTFWLLDGWVIYLLTQ